MLAKKVNLSREQLLDPEAAAWKKEPAEVAPLHPTPAALIPSAYVYNAWKGKEFGKVKEVTVAALHNNDDIFFRLQWDDATQNLVESAEASVYPDAAAILFPLKGDAPLMVMGTADQPVCAWYWRADFKGKAQNDVARGLGTTHRTPCDIYAQGRWHNGVWDVVFARRLRVKDSANQIEFTVGKTCKVAFAIWDGQNGERNGIKAYSPHWHDFTLSA